MPPDPPPYDEVVALARRAPSFHNTQPWLWRDDGDHLDLVSDESRRLPYSDPDGRSLVVSCGAALHHLQVAAAGLGWAADVTRVPDPADPRLLARVRMRPRVASPDESRLLHCLTVRHTDRRPFAPQRPGDDLLDGLVAAGERCGTTVERFDAGPRRERLRQLALQADRLQRQDTSAAAELAAWTSFRRGEGVPASSVSDRTAVGAGFPNRFRPGAGDSGREAGDEGDVPTSWETGPVVLLVATSSDDRLCWLRAGETLSAMWLEATRQGLSLLPVNQCIEVTSTREQVTQQVLGNRLCAQVLAMVGQHPSGAAALPRTRRRPVEDVMVRG
jgi:hypothetical protein